MVLSDMAKRRKAQGDEFSGMPILGVGWRAIPNPFFDIYMPIMNQQCPGAFDVLLYVYRQTVGLDRKDAMMSTRWIARGVGLGQRKTGTALRWLVGYEFLRKTPQPIKIGRYRNLPAITFSYSIAGQILDDIYTLPDPEDANPRERPWLSPKLQKMLAAEAKIKASLGEPQ